MKAQNARHSQAKQTDFCRALCLSNSDFEPKMSRCKGAAKTAVCNVMASSSLNPKKTIAIVAVLIFISALFLALYIHSDRHLLIGWLAVSIAVSLWVSKYRFRYLLPCTLLIFVVGVLGATSPYDISLTICDPVGVRTVPVTYGIVGSRGCDVPLLPAGSYDIQIKMGLATCSHNPSPTTHLRA